MCDASFQPNVLKTTRKGVNVWNWARQSSSLIVLAVLRSPASITRSRAAKWGKVGQDPVSPGGAESELEYKNLRCPNSTQGFPSYV